MASLNKVQLIGNLGADPEIRYSANGALIVTATLATTEQWKDRSTGERNEHTEWHRIVFFRNLAETAGEYLEKGMQVYIEGKLQTRKWKDKNDADRYSTEILVQEFKMLGKKNPDSMTSPYTGDGEDNEE